MSRDEPIKYGNISQVSRELAPKPVAPRDAAAAKAAEIDPLGWNPRGGGAAAAQNERAGHVVGGDQDVKLSETFYSGNRVVKESVGGQEVRNIGEPQMARRFTGEVVIDSDPITIGEALEAAAFSGADKVVEQSDVAAIRAAEARATGISAVRPGDVAAAAQAAAEINAGAARSEDGATLYDVLVNARARMVADKVVTMEDVEQVIDAEIGNKPSVGPTCGGVAGSLFGAAQINHQADHK